MDWKEVLRRRLATPNTRPNKKKSEQELKDEEMDLFTKYYSEWKGGRKNTNEFYKTIPRFYYRLPAEDEVLLQKLREESRAVFLQRKSRELLDNEELQNLWFLLDKHQTPPMIGEEAMINYENFLKVGEKAGAKCKQFFTAKVFAKLLHTDSYGRISIMQFFNYVMRKVWLHQTRIGLSLYDVAGQGYLRESDLENYILELIPTLPQLDGLEKSFYSFYVCTAVRKFFFFLDPLRTGKRKSYLTYMKILLYLNLNNYRKLLKCHLFSCHFQNLPKINGDSVPVRVLAIYFYQIQAIQELMKIHGQDPVSFQDVKDEIFDMVKPKDPLKISLQDLINSNQGDTVTTILIDLNGFWTYENREALVANDSENSTDLDDT
ncbi:PREDICTED: serine/threonine-protein phosphatase 2A regulatory subunit B'' subunit gamma [Mandrillus leucophaeus]|uniref:serine/threonine-protein phosphatase 2A regulatory subunit B'' subunit gamma n=1 Tax=Mandrillus leucophaeus TaxID=9568 RepID=UPI0005F4ED12|nr:PREDICTED: serine/threonine-protein phosphatase 2A regulatory subunit B'' subunit gamma [Mandrillus leucophaeus]